MTVEDLSGLRCQRVGADLLLPLRVTPKARRPGLTGVHGGALKVAVRAAPDKGRANDAVCRLLADTFGLARRSVTLVSGHTSRNKRVRLAGLAEDRLRARLASILPQTGDPSCAQTSE